MVIDILTVVHRNYTLLDLQRDHWRRNIRGDYRLLVADNTPAPERRACAADIVMEMGGTDGETHGGALDALIRLSSSEVIGMVDTDYFWTKPDLLALVEELFASDVVCFGAGGFYADFQMVIDVLYPHRAGALAPVAWGMFVKRDLALQHSFVTTSEHKSETGWRLREALVQEHLSRVTLPGHADQYDPELYWFGPEDSPPFGFHLLKGSGARASLTRLVPRLIQAGVSQWRGSRPDPQLVVQQ